MNNLFIMLFYSVHVDNRKTLFRTKKFMLDEVFQQQIDSKFDTFLE